VATNLRRLQPASVDLFTVAETRELARLAGSLSDAAVLGLIRRSTAAVETYLNRSLIAAQWRQTFDGFSGPAGDWILPLLCCPVIEVEDVEYLDDEGSWQIVDPESFGCDTDGEPARVYEWPGSTWPEAADVPGSVRVTFQAGYGEAASDVPGDLVEAVAKIISHNHDHVGAVVTGTIVAEIPWSVRELLEMYRYGAGL
jgi:uncharacterized phiE125 gp8 family phage protein